MKILVIEDEAKAATYLRQGLAEAGYVVDVAHDGDAGLAAAQSHDYALILCDVTLPRRDGFSLERFPVGSSVDVMGTRAGRIVMLIAVAPT
ncbi:MAG: response regulator, partial [Gemmatimonadaceae bacterium]